MKSISEFSEWTKGFQIRTPRRPRKDAPDWAKDQMSLLTHVIGIKSLRRLRIAYLYWFVGYTAKEAADEVGMTVNAVELLLRRIKNRPEAV